MKFTAGAGNRWYVSHLDKSMTLKQLFTKEVFTSEILNKMEPIVNNYFRYKSIEEAEAVEKQFESLIEGDEDEDGFTNSSDVDAEDFFGK